MLTLHHVQILLSWALSRVGFGKLRGSKSMTVRGFFGIAAYQSKDTKNVGMLWRSATLFGAAFVATVEHRYVKQPSDTMNCTRHTPLHHYTDIADLASHLPHGCLLVGVELTSEAEPLHSFVHPLRAVYLLGSENHGLPDSVLKQCDHAVQIITARLPSLNVAVAGSLICYDRYTKTRNAQK